jgi:hypothetical protein
MSKRAHGFAPSSATTKSSGGSDLDGSGASRQSVGFEVLKKFSTSTSTVASIDFQGSPGSAGWLQPGAQ